MDASRIVRRLAFPLILTLILAACGGSSASPTATAVPTTPATPTAGSASATGTPRPELSWEQVFDQLRPSTVRISGDFPATAVSDEGAGSGTGIVLNNDGYIITNAHVVDGAAALTVAAANSTREQPAKFVGISPCDDLAVIKVDNMQGLKPATFGSSGTQRVGGEVAVLGYPLRFNLGIDMSVTRGIISKLDQTLAPYESLIQTDAAINPGNSGGPMVNRQGEVIGINTLGVDPSYATNINFAISIDEAMRVIPELAKGQNRDWLGMNLGPNNYEDYFGTDEGLVVEAVASGGPAAKSGVQPAFLLTKLEGLSVNSMADVCKVLRSHRDGDTLRVDFLNVTDTEAQILQGQVMIGQGTNAAPVKVVASQPLAGVTPTPAPAAPTPTRAAANPTATTGGSGTVTKSWDFTSDTGDWYHGEYDDATVTLGNGSYSIVFKVPNYTRVPTVKSIPAVGDQSVAANVKLDKGFTGVAARFSSTSDNKWSYYLCWIDDADEYGCGVFVQDQYTSLVQTTKSTQIKHGDYNLLQITMVGNQGTFSLNGQQIGTFTDSNLAKGQPGLYAAGAKDVAGSATFKSVGISYIP